MNITYKKKNEKKRLYKKEYHDAQHDWHNEITKLIEHQHADIQKQLPLPRTKKNRNRKVKRNTEDTSSTPPPSIDKKQVQSAAMPQLRTQQIPLVKPYTYHQRILQWFNHSPQKTKTSILYHTHPLIIDAFLQTYGIKNFWQNKGNANQKDTQFMLPGYIENNGIKRFAVFGCTLTPTHCCYHRHCKLYPNFSAIHEELKAYGQWTVEGDNFGQNVTTAQYIPAENDYGTILEETDQTVKIKDHHNNRIITLFKSCCDTEISQCEIK